MFKSGKGLDFQKPEYFFFNIKYMNSNKYSVSSMQAMRKSGSRQQN